MTETATLGGGCFWCLDAFYKRVNGIQSVISGYSGGSEPDPSEDKVHQGNTGHAEVVQLTFDPNIITYKELLEIFFVMHDPTTINRQGNDVGEEYRSVIFYHYEEQKSIAADMIKNYAAKLWKDPVVTQVEKFEKFYPAADYHQDFYDQNPNQGYCMIIIDPKIQKLRQKFASKLIE